MKPMTKEELAELLNGRQYGEEITDVEHRIAYENGLVVIFGASDDLTIFKGIIDTEVYCYEGCHFKFNKELIVKVGDKHKGHRRSVEAVWCESYDTGNGFEMCSWRYKTEIPHATFNIYEDGELYCVGIIIDVSQIPY